MRTEDAFLLDILDHPEDDTPRLVFADWLEEHGTTQEQQARSEFIRLQIARARLSPHDCRQRILARREHILLGEFAQVWVGPLQPHIRGWRFRRGFIERITLSANDFVLHGMKLFKQAPIREVHLRELSQLGDYLSGPGIQDTFSRLLKRVKVLDLTLNYFNTETLEALLHLPELPRLEKLYLGKGRLSRDVMRTLTTSPLTETLTTLGINGSMEDVRDVQHLLRQGSWPLLTSLGLKDMDLQDRAIPGIAGLPVLGQFTSLSLGHNNITANGIASLARLGNLDNLSVLDLSFNSLGQEAIPTLADAAFAPQLLELNLSRTDQGNEGAHALAASSLFERLYSVDLSLNRMDDVGGMELARYEGPSRLTTLDLIYNRLNTRTQSALEQRFGAEVCLFAR